MNAKPDCQLLEDFVFPALIDSPLLHPIRTWDEMYREMQDQGIAFDEAWHECASEGVVSFFRWTGVVRATVLVVCPGPSPVHIEVRGQGDVKLDGDEYVSVVAEVERVLSKVAVRYGLTAIH